MNIEIRKEIQEDHDSITKVNNEAFGQTTESNIIAGIRNSESDYLSQVAIVDGGITGHIFFSAVQVEGSTEITGMGLAPMAVMPDYQNMGIGSRLVNKDY